MYRLFAPRQPALPPESAVPQVRFGALSVLQRAIPLLGGLAALALAGAGEALINQGNRMSINLTLYTLGILVFALSASPVWPYSPELSASKPATAARGRWLGWAMLVVGTAAAFGLGLAAMKELHSDLKSVAGTWLWLASLLTIGAT